MTAWLISALERLPPWARRVVVVVVALLFIGAAITALLKEALEAMAPPWPWLRTHDDRRKRRCRALNVEFFAFIASARAGADSGARVRVGASDVRLSCPRGFHWSHSSSNAGRGRRSSFCLLDWPDA